MGKDAPIGILIYKEEYEMLVSEVIANREVPVEMMNYVYYGAFLTKLRNEQLNAKDDYEIVQKMLETAYLQNLEYYFKDEDISIRGVDPARIFGGKTAAALSRSVYGFDEWMAGYNGSPDAENFAVVNKGNVTNITKLLANALTAIEEVMNQQLSNQKEGEMKWKEN